MRFQKLTIHNIASIEDAVIDFEKEPLSHSEVFLITGKTGSGKSTILDAICLALYSNTPRLSSTAMQGDVTDGSLTMTLKDPRQLMRRNTAEAYVELRFLGTNGIHYEARWSVARANKKPEGKIQSKTWTLTNLDTDTSLTKVSDIEPEIKAATGLEFSQFCRTTMLAQGEFTRFLNSKDDEKAAILEKITGVDIYSRIGAKIFELTTKKEKACKEAEQLISGTRVLSDEEISERKAKIDDLDKDMSMITSENQKETARRDWIIRNNELAQACEKAEEEHKMAIEAIESEPSKARERLIRDWNATTDARLWLAESNKAEKELASCDRELGYLKDEFSRLLGGYGAMELGIRDSEVKLAGIDDYLLRESVNAQVYENYQTIRKLLSDIDEGNKVILQGQERISKERKLMLEKYQPELEKAGASLEKAKEAYDGKDKEIRGIEEEISRLGLSDKRKERESLTLLLADIKTARERISALDEAKSKREQKEKDIKELLAAINRKKDRSTSMDTPIHDAQLRMETKKEDLDRQKDSVDKFSKALRAKLKPGDTCPVCRQRIDSALPHEDMLSELVSGLEKAYEKAEAEYRKLADEKTRIETEIRVETGNYNKELEAYNNDRSVKTATEKALSSCQACDIKVLDENTMSCLDAKGSNATDRKEELDKAILDGEKKENALKVLRTELDKLRGCHDTLLKEHQEAQNAEQKCLNDIRTAEALCNQKQEDMRNSTEEISRILSETPWEQEWNSKDGKFGQKIDRAAKEYQKKVKDRETISTGIDKSRDLYNSISSVIESIVGCMPSWKDAERLEAGSVDPFKQACKIKDNVIRTQTGKEAAEKKLKENKGKLDEFLSSTVSGIDIARLSELGGYSLSDIEREDSIRKIENEAVVKASTLLDNARKLINEHGQKKPQIPIEYTLDIIEELIRNHNERLKGIAEEKGAILQDLKTDEDNRKKVSTLREDAEKKKEEYLKWSKMNQFIGDSTGKKFQKIAQSYVLSNLIHSANTYMRTLTDRYVLKVEPGTFVICLEDAYQGYVSRSASTISGGESFLVSLSLALALSDIGQMLSVDTLFIDEGFGTLSGEPLQNAINTLRSLHSKAGRHVGIISHVEELRERISVQIQVEQEGNCSASTVRIVP